MSAAAQPGGRLGEHGPAQPFGEAHHGLGHALGAGPAHDHTTAFGEAHGVDAGARLTQLGPGPAVLAAAPVLGIELLGQGGERVA